MFLAKNGAVCIQLTHFSYDDCENTCTCNLSHYHHRQIGSMSYLPLFRKSVHAIQFKLGVQPLGECSELTCFLDMLPKLWPFSGHKTTENGGF